jgi:UPF0716 family protein affecting phage T7 exclusion
MGLTEREQKLLDELEKSLGAGPTATAKRKLAVGNISGRRVIVGTLIFVGGLVALLSGVMNQSLLIGLFGFVAMLGGVYLAASTTSSK